jgi:FkbM family methyltransferase
MYSQNEEEKYILEIFKGKRDGRFLDIGAYHPFDLSNTRALYELGWSGVMVEPSPGPFMTLLREYGKDSRIELVQASVGLNHGTTSMFATDAAVSTSSLESYRKWEKEEDFYGKFWSPLLTMENLWNQFGAFNFVNIDAEGISIELFFHVPFGAMQPMAVCVEHNGERLIELGAHAQKYGYRQIYICQENSIFVRSG